MLPLGEELRFRGLGPGVTPGETTPRGEDSGSSVGPEPISTELPHEEQKRAAPGNSFPHAGHFISLWPEYTIAASMLWLHREAPPEETVLRDTLVVKQPKFTQVEGADTVMPSSETLRLASKCPSSPPEAN